MKYRRVLILVCFVVAGVLWSRPAAAVKPFMEQFSAVYVKPQTADHNMKIFNSAVAKVGCNLCHKGQPQNKNMNAYGAELKKLLNPKRDAQNAQKIRAAFAQVGKMKSNPSDPKSQTFAARIKEGKLPVGEIKVRSKNAGGDGKE